MLGAQPAGAYGWLPTRAGLLLFLTARCDAGRALWEGKAPRVGDVLRKYPVKTRTQRGGSGMGRSLGCAPPWSRAAPSSPRVSGNYARCCGDVERGAGRCMPGDACPGGLSETPHCMVCCTPRCQPERGWSVVVAPPASLLVAAGHMDTGHLGCSLLWVLGSLLHLLPDPFLVGTVRTDFLRVKQ